MTLQEQERIAEEISDVPVPQVMEETVEAAKYIPRRGVQNLRSGASR